MVNFKKIGMISLLVGGVVFISGCGQTNTAAHNNTNKNGLPRGNNASSTEKMFNAGAKATLADLVVGKKVTVVGTANSDGTVSAKRIMIGEPGGFMMRGATSTTSTGENFRFNNSNQPPPASSGQFNGQNRGQMGMGGQRPNGGGRAMGGNGMVRGEIISKDETSLVIKNQDGGSKIVFYSDKTEVSIFQPPTSTPPAPTTSPEKI